MEELTRAASLSTICVRNEAKQRLHDDFDLKYTNMKKSPMGSIQLSGPEVVDYLEGRGDLVCRLLTPITPTRGRMRAETAVGHHAVLGRTSLVPFIGVLGPW